MDPEGRLMCAETLDRAVEVQPLTIDLWPPGFHDCVGDGLRGYLSEQAAAVAGFRRNANLERRKLRGEVVGLFAVAHLAHLARTPDRLHLFEGALRRAVGQSARDQEIPRVAVGNVDDVARATERPHLLRQD